MTGQARPPNGEASTCYNRSVATEVYERTIDDGALRPTHLTIDLGILRRNFESLDRHVGPAQVLPILKANAYGHGLVEVARMLETTAAAGVGVAYLEEGLRLRRHGVRLPVLVLGGLSAEQIPHFLAHDLTLTASSVDKLRAIDERAGALGRTARVHLKIDTGMERIGVHWYSADKLLEASLAVRHTEVAGIFTHFACADDRDRTLEQLGRFHEVLRFYEKRSIPPPRRHASSSASLVTCPEAHLDLVRPGVVFYGVSPSPGLDVARLGVAPALRWSTQVVFFKVVRAGDPVSYGGTYRPAEMERIVTLPVGYGDGYPRAMSGHAEVLIHGRRHRVVGRICMDQAMASIGWQSAHNGDVVTLIGGDGPERIRVEDLAAWAGTIPHEILACINTRVPRLYVGA